MRRLLALAALVAAMPVANAQDKGKSEFTPSAEYRPRYFFMNNAGGTEANDSFAEHRFKMGAHYKANEKFSAHATLLHAADFGAATTAIGSTNGADINANYDTGNQENFLNVNEAYMNWMVSDDFTLRVGRMNFQIADGYVFGYNDWEQNPGAFDGVTGVWEAEFGRFTGFVFNYKEEATGASVSDAKHTAYGLSFDLKSMPDFMKMVNVHVIQDNNDAVPGTAATTQTVQSNDAQNVLRYGLGLGFDFGLIDLKAHYAAQSGDYRNIAATGVKTSLDAKGMMYDAELGFKLESFMGSRLYVLYHVDSGDDNAADGDAGRYDPYFYEQHSNAGLMDLFNWGNLTQMTVGWTMKPGDNTDAGLTYNMFQKTESKDGFNAGRFGTALGAGSGTSDKLGDEIDLWAEHRYDGGLSTLIRLGYFMPGDVFDNSVSKRDEAIMHVAVEGKLTF
jgi:hypothetical protein